MSRTIEIAVPIGSSTQRVHVGILRQDIAPGEPGSLHSELEIAPGERCIVTLHHGGAIVISDVPPHEGN